MTSNANPNFVDFQEISDSQRIHDLAVAYTTYLAMRRKEETEPDSFYQDYENYYGNFSKLVKHYR